MQVYWWQGGVHVEPESDDERAALFTLAETLNLTDVSQEVDTGPVATIQTGDH